MFQLDQLLQKINQDRRKRQQQAAKATADPQKGSTQTTRPAQPVLPAIGGASKKKKETAKSLPPTQATGGGGGTSFLPSLFVTSAGKGCGGKEKKKTPKKK